MLVRVPVARCAPGRVGPDALAVKSARRTGQTLWIDPAALLMGQPMRFDFVVNQRTARELGITFPNELLLQVTEVLQ